MTKKEIIVELDKLGLDFNPNANKDTLLEVLNNANTASEETLAEEIEEQEELLDETSSEEPTELSDNDVLLISIDATIGIANKIMSKDRSRVLRLKNLVGKLNDAKRLIK